MYHQSYGAHQYLPATPAAAAAAYRAAYQQQQQQQVGNVAIRQSHPELILIALHSVMNLV